MSNAAAALLRDPKVRDQYARLKPEQRAAFEWRARWLMAAHKHQLEPLTDKWSIWLMCAGRGAGKTRAAAENLGWWAWQNPNTRWLVSAPTSSDLRATCYEGDSGLLSVIPPVLIRDYNKSLHELVLVNGPAWKQLIEEEYGDGIMSAIDFNMEFEREANPKGDRVKITMSGKFLPFKYYGNEQGIPDYGFKEE
jgi:phage terminase large subunit-like protein